MWTSPLKPKEGLSGPSAVMARNHLNATRLPRGGTELFVVRRILLAAAALVSVFLVKLGFDWTETRAQRKKDGKKD